MSEPFLSEIKIVSFNFPPKGWAMCNGQLLPINQNQALFALLGTTYGGNGQTNFALPNLRGRVPNSFGQGLSLGQAAGEEAHTLTISELPAHTHITQGTSEPHVASPENYQPIPTGALLATVNGMYGNPTNQTTLHPSTITSVGGSQAHENRSPYLVLNFIIALQGIFPSQN